MNEQLRLKAPTIVEVAEAAGVAIGTVSRYLNGGPVRPSNRDSIEEAIGKLGYRRNLVAASMKTDFTHVVGLMASTLTEHHSAILEQLSRKMRAAGRAVLAFQHDANSKAVDEGLDFFASHRVDCLVMDASHSESNAGAAERLRALARQGTPIVFYDNDIPALAADRVFVEDRAASYRIVRHLLDLGHKKIAVITGPQQHHTGHERLAGYLDALQEAGIEIQQDYIADGRWTEIEGYKAMRQLLGLQDRPTAVFSSNYNMTIGALSLFKEMKLRVPHDLSLVSFDDVPLFRLHETGITCVAQPIERIAETIKGLLLDRLSENAHFAPNTTVVLDCEIILRGSARRADA